MKQLTEENKNVLNNIAYSITQIVWDCTGRGFCEESLDNASSAIWRIIDR